MIQRKKFPQIVIWVGKITRFIFGLLLLLVLGQRTATAHSQHTHLHVAPTGADSGNCQNSQQPCRTLQYAVRLATGKGDEVRVGAGEYVIDDATAQMMLHGLMWVEGGYSPRDNFANANYNANPTILYGAHFSFRAALQAQGFVLLPDKKGLSAANHKRDDGVAAARAPSVNPSRPNTSTASAPAACVNGFADIYPCYGMDLLAHISLSQMLGSPASASNIWGHVDLNTGREYALIGVRSGTLIVDVTNPISPTQVALVPALSSLWRELRAYQIYDANAGRYKAYAYVVTEATGQGLQIIDLNQLPMTATLAATFTNWFARAHTIHLGQVDYNTNMPTNGAGVAYVNGANTYAGAFQVLDLTNPISPTQLHPPNANAQYTHDGTWLTITDTRTSQCANGHNPCELYIDFNEDTVTIWDVTVPATQTLLSTTPYTGSRYTHSGWFTQDKRFVFIMDELDEYYNGHNTKIRTLDITSLLAPNVSATWTGTTRAIEHNGYTKGNDYFVSHYQRGISVFDVSNPNAIVETQNFDTYPAADGAGFNGVWGVYPYLPSGIILASDIEGGLWVLQKHNAVVVLSPPTLTTTPTATPTAPATPTSTPTGTLLPTASTTPTPTLNPRVFLPSLWR